MSFDDHDRCRRCGTDDTASHTTAECDRMTGECPNCRPGATCAACLDFAHVAHLASGFNRSPLCARCPPLPSNRAARRKASR